MDATLTDKERAYVEACREFAGGYLQQHFKRYDDANVFAEDIHEEAFRRGILNAAIPGEWGGQGMRHIALAEAGMVMARVCAPTTFSMGFNHGTMRPLLMYGTDRQKRDYIQRFVAERRYISWCMTEPDISGSNLFDIRTTATRTANGWLLQGTKCMIGNGTRADLYLVLARTMEDGEFTGLSIFLMPRQHGVEVSDNNRKLGFHSLPTPAVSFHTEIPADAVLGGVGFGVDVLMDSLDFMRFGGGIILVGLCQGALQDIREFTTARKVYGGMLSEKSHIQINVGRHIAEALNVELLLKEVARILDAGGRCPNETAALKLLGSTLAQKITDEAVQIAGWRGIDDDYPMQKRYRDARQATIYEGTNEVLAMNLFNQYLESES
ncbi:MAG: acyl-CoA dehydrogenase family protein [Ketobacteraceae bacterium]|nr:acyl-CoA dehydrogenase family protein [Ketobacteraceae bacterium]